MRSNRSRDTRPEVKLRSALHAAGLRFRKDYAIGLGAGKRVRPDIVFTRARVVVFVDGCFWHQCPEHGRQPRSNREYWGPKLSRNCERDRENDLLLDATGWRVVRCWEHEDTSESIHRIKAALGAKTMSATAGRSSSRRDRSKASRR